MIDSDWFAQICDLAGANIPGQDHATLCRQLGVQDEVLPYLLVSGGGFSDWSATRTAIRKAVRGVTRPNRSRVGSGFDPADKQLRRELRDSIREVLVASDTSSAEGGIGHAKRKASRLIARHSEQSQGLGYKPHTFIPL